MFLPKIAVHAPGCFSDLGNDIRVNSGKVERHQLDSNLPSGPATSLHEVKRRWRAPLHFHGHFFVRPEGHSI